MISGERIESRAEMLGGHRFVWSPRTPRVRTMVDALESTIAATFRRNGVRASLRREPDILLSPQTAMIPDLAISLGASYDVPDLIVEYRAESTDRLFFGPKRLAYARSRVPEVWFADPGSRVVTVLRLESGVDYPWPAAAFRDGDVVVGRAVDLCIPVAAFFEARGGHGDA